MIISYLYKQPDHLNHIQVKRANGNNICYFGFLETFLESLAVTNPQEKVFLRLFNFSEEQCEHLKNLHRTKSGNETLTLEKREVDMSSWKTTGDFEKARQLTHITLPLEKLDADKRGVIYMDVDCLVRGSLSEMYNHLSSCGATMQTWRTYGARCDYQLSKADLIDCRDEAKMCGGVMGFRGAGGRAFLEEWGKRYHQERKFDWWTIQLLCYRLFQDMGGLASSLRTIPCGPTDILSADVFAELGRPFHDMRFGKDSTVWHANLGNKPMALKRFRQELSK